MNKDKAGTIEVKGFHKPKKMTESHKKKLKSAEKHVKDVAYAKKSNKPLKGFKAPPKIVRVK